MGYLVIVTVVIWGLSKLLDNAASGGKVTHRHNRRK